MNARSTLLAAMTMLMLASTGCVVEPLHEDVIFDRHHDTFDFIGFGYKPYQQIRIQAWNKDAGPNGLGDWVTLRTTYARGTPINWNSVTGGGSGSPITKLYLFTAYDVAIPLHHYWDYHTDDPNFGHMCELRVVDQNEKPLVTFNQNYPGASAAWSMSLNTLWNLAGHGETMTVYSVN